MKIAFNPSTVAALTTPPNNKDITFDLRGRNIFARGVKFYGTDTNTWRDIKINNVSIDSHTLDLRNGSNTTLTNTNGVVTINSTWRPVVDNLTSDSTTSSLSAKQGKVLKALIDGKSNSDHNHDGRYLRLSGQDTMQGNLYLHSHGTSYIGKGLGDKSGADFTEANIVIRSWWGISFKSNDDIVRTYIDTRTGNIGTKGVLNAVGAVIQGRVYNDGDDEGIIINPASNGCAGLILGTHNGERSVFYLKKGNPFWRYNNGSTNLNIYHPKKSGTIALTSDIPNKNSWNYDDRYLRLTGGWMSGDINFGDDNKICWGRNTDSASISFKNDGDANDTIQFKTNTASRLYHNNYPILTTQNTYVSNNKGYINGTEITQVNNADTLDGYQAASFVKMKQFRFSQYRNGFWTKILTITINSTSDYQPVIAFNWIPSECARDVWAEFTINWRSNSPIFYAIWKGTAVRTLTCVNSSGNIWNVWVQGSKNIYDPFGEVQVTYAHNISSYNGGSLGYSDSDPGGTRCTLGGYVNYAKSTGNADTLDGYHANDNNNRPYGHIPTIKSDGVMEVGRYIDFHNDNNGEHDFSTRLQSTGNYGNVVNLPSASGTLALINDVNNYYWANVKISTSSSTTTSPTFSNVYLGNSLHLNNKGLNSIYNGPNDFAKGVGGPLNNLVFSSWYGVSFTTSCPGFTYTNKNAVSISCRTGQLFAREVQANGFVHTDHNNNDAVLLAGGGYKTLKDFIFLNKPYNYTDNEHYDLKFYKLSGICHNLVWVEGFVTGSIIETIIIDPVIYPYTYNNDINLDTIYLMPGNNNYISVSPVGMVIIHTADYHKQKVEFFYVGQGRDDFN